MHSYGKKRRSSSLYFLLPVMRGVRCFNQRNSQGFFLTNRHLNMTNEHMRSDSKKAPLVPGSAFLLPVM